MATTNATSKSTRRRRLERDRKAAELLAEGKLTVAEVARRLRVHRTTLWRRLKSMAAEEGLACAS